MKMMDKSWKSRGKWRPNIGTYADPKAMIVEHIKACNKSIEHWQHSNNHIARCGKQLMYLYEMRDRYMECLNEYRM